VGRGWALLGAAALIAFVAVAFVLRDGGEEEEARPEPTTGREQGFTVVYAIGDGADGSSASRELADYVISQDPDRFFYLGDVYETGTPAEFRENYHDLYGPLVMRTDPVIGNHEYRLRFVGYDSYWRRERGWTRNVARRRAYVDEPSGWQVIAYSSEDNPAREAAWVRRQVRRHGGTCRIVIAHKGRHTVADAVHGDNTDQDLAWRHIAGKTAINLIGHNHIYGRLEPIDGVTVIVSGAGGHGLRELGRQHHPVAASETGIPTATRLLLRRGAADLRQVTATGDVVDSTTIRCTPADR
jgi:hypothetical protein